MSAKSKIIATIVTATVFTGGSDKVAFAATVDQTCMTMARTNAATVSESLELFAGEPLGKPPELWETKDFQALLANAKVCDGLPANVIEKVRFTEWSSAMNAVYPSVKAVSDVSVPVFAKYAGMWPGAKEGILCSRIFDFRKDPIWLSNNADEMFGIAFEKMSPAQLQAVRSYTSECKPALLGILKSRPGNTMPTGIIDRLLKSIGLSLDRDQKIPDVHIDNLVKDLIPVRDGKPVPLAYVSPNTVGIVRRVNTSLLRNVKMQTEDLVLISKWAEDVYKLTPEGPDRAYAERVRTVVQKQMFPD